MAIEARIFRLNSSLHASANGEVNPSAETIQRWLSELNEMQGPLNHLNAAMQRVADVNMALTLTTRLFEATHTEKLDADQVWCLLDPLWERLDRAIEDMKLSL
ncbi:hypothetical protein [Pseudomonas sp. LP_7_YM]|uniref:hypothetical protein n=1 Tax=Pseudomonas sp. LP_7_YM TaxID=2485137 RepID=UPI00105DAF52|nr:hypothetical protein [Pseudomonas sp. LP_7_YM]TDV64548.1 hypothetical protein EC915_105253 [Pseudomonas sp. LP_7_YM]